MEEIDKNLEEIYKNIIIQVEQDKDIIIKKKSFGVKEIIDIKTDTSFDNNDVKEMIRKFSLLTNNNNKKPSFTKSYRDIFIENDTNKLRNEIFKIKNLILSNNKNVNVSILDKLHKNEYLISEEDKLQYLFINNINLTPIVDDIQNYYLSKPNENLKNGKSFRFYNNYFDFQRIKDEKKNKYSWEKKNNDNKNNFFTSIKNGEYNSFNNESEVYNIINQWYKQFKFKSKNTLKKNEVIEGIKGIPYKLYKKLLNEGTSLSTNVDLNWITSSITDENKDLIMFKDNSLKVPSKFNNQWINKCCENLGRCNTIQQWTQLNNTTYEFPSLLRIYNRKNDKNIVNLNIKTKLIRKNINLPYNPELLDNDSYISYHNNDNDENINIIERYSYKSIYILEDDLSEKKIKKSCQGNKYPELIDLKEKNIPMSIKLIDGESINMTGIYISSPEYNLSNGIEIILDNNENINKYYPKINNDGINIYNRISYNNSFNLKNNNHVNIKTIDDSDFYEKYDKNCNYFLNFKENVAIENNLKKILPSIDNILEIEDSNINKCNNFTDLSKIFNKYQFCIYDLTHKQMINLKKKIDNNSKKKFYEIEFYDELNMKIFFKAIDYLPITDVFTLNEDINVTNFIEYLKFYSLFLCCNKLKLVTKNDIIHKFNMDVHSNFNLNCVTLNFVESKKYLKLGSLLIPLYEHFENIEIPFDIRNKTLKELIENKINEKLNSNEMFKKMYKLKNKVNYEQINSIYELEKLKKYNYYNIDNFNLLFKNHLINLLKCSFDNGNLFFQYLKQLNMKEEQEEQQEDNHLAKNYIDQIRELKKSFLTNYDEYVKKDRVVKIYYNYQSLKNDNGNEDVYYDNEYDETSSVSTLLNTTTERGREIKKIFFPDINEETEYDEAQKQKLLKLYYPFNTEKDIEKKIKNFNKDEKREKVAHGDFCLLIEDGVKDFYKRVRDSWIKCPTQKCNNLKNLNLEKILESKNYDQLFNCKNCIANCNICQGNMNDQRPIWNFIKKYNILVNQLSIIVANEKINKKVKYLDEKIATRIKFNNKKNNKKFNLNKKYIEENDNIDKNKLNTVLYLTGFENRNSYEKNLIRDLTKELTSKSNNINIKNIVDKYQLELNDKNYFYYKYDNKKMKVLCSHFIMNDNSLKEIKHKIDNEIRCKLCGFVFDKELYDNTDFFPNSYGEINDNLNDDVLEFNSLVNKLMQSVSKVKIIKNLNQLINSSINYKIKKLKKWKLFNKKIKKKLLPEEDKHLIDDDQDNLDIKNNDIIDPIIKNLFKNYNLSGVYENKFNGKQLKFILNKNFNFGSNEDIKRETGERYENLNAYQKKNNKIERIKSIWKVISKKMKLDKYEKDIYNFIVKDDNKNIIELWDDTKRDKNIKATFIKNLKKNNIDIIKKNEIKDFCKKYKINKSIKKIFLVPIEPDENEQKRLDFLNKDYPIDEVNIRTINQNRSEVKIFTIFKDYELKYDSKIKYKLNKSNIKGELEKYFNEKGKKSLDIFKVSKLKIKYYLLEHDRLTKKKQYYQIVIQFNCLYNYNLWANKINKDDIQKIRTFYDNLHIKTMMYFFIKELNSEGDNQLDVDKDVFIDKANLDETKDKKKNIVEFYKKFKDNLKKCYEVMEKDKQVEIITDYNWKDHEPFFSNDEVIKLKNIKKSVSLIDIKNKDDNKKNIFVTDNNYLNFNLSKELTKNKNNEIDKNELKRKLKLINTIYYNNDGNYIKRYFRQIYDHDYDKLFEYLELDENENCDKEIQFPDNDHLIKKLLMDIKEKDDEKNLKKGILDQMDKQLANIYKYDLDKLKKICINHYIKPKKEKDQVINQIIDNNLHYVELDINNSKYNKETKKLDLKFKDDIEVENVEEHILIQKLNNFEVQTNKKINKFPNFIGDYTVDDVEEWDIDYQKKNKIKINLDHKYDEIKNIYENNFKIENINDEHNNKAISEYINNQKNNEQNWFKINFIKDLFTLISKSKFEKKNGQIEIINRINLELSKKYLNKNEIDYFSDLIKNNNDIKSNRDGVIPQIEKMVKLIQSINDVSHLEKDFKKIEDIVLNFYKTNYKNAQRFWEQYKMNYDNLPWSKNLFDPLSEIENYSDTYIQSKIKEYNENENTLRRKRYEKKSDEERESHGLIRKLKLGNIINENEREEELFDNQENHAGKLNGKEGINNHDNQDPDNENNGI